MAGIILSGPAGRIEATYHQSTGRSSPVALILHPHPQLGGSMETPVVRHLYQAFIDKGFSVLRFNFRGVGRSEGEFENGPGELADAATLLDWLQETNLQTTRFWVAGHSFGAWVGMQLLMRRPELTGFISVAPPANIYDFGFLAPCPSSGLIIHGSDDKVAPVKDIRELVAHLKSQRGISIMHQEIAGAGHVFRNRMPELVKMVHRYLATRQHEEVAKDIKPLQRAAVPRR